MPNIVVYGGRMGSSFRPHWMLAELGLEYETRKIDFSAGDNRKPEYLALNPLGQIPTLVHDDFVLTESAAMAHFLSEKYGGHKFFGPQTPESHATMLRWELYVLLNVNPAFTTLASKTWGMPASAEDEDKANAALARFLPPLEAWLSTRQYVVGDDFTVADVVIRSSFNYAEAAGFDLSAYPAITAWMARCAERPAYVKAKQG